MHVCPPKMSSTKVLASVLLAHMVSIHVSAQNTVPYGMTPELRQRIIDEHNRLRRTVHGANMVKIQYDEKLECVAKNFAGAYSGNVFTGHNQNSEADYAACGGSGPVGENWFSGPPGDATYAWVDMKWDPYNQPSGCSERESWMAQKKDDKATLYSAEYYRAVRDCSADKFSKWGHYTQVMWVETTHVGCWYTKTFGTLCNYSPAGNMYNWTGVMLPYVTYGTPCSACPQSHAFCDAGLCSATQPNSSDLTTSTYTSTKPTTATSPDKPVTKPTTTTPTTTTTTTKTTTTTTTSVSVSVMQTDDKAGVDTGSSSSSISPLTSETIHVYDVFVFTTVVSLVRSLII